MIIKVIMNYPYPDTETGRQLTDEFYEKFKNDGFFGYREDGIGAEEVHQFPATPLHVELYPHLYRFTFSYYQSYITRFMGVWCGYVYYEGHPLQFDVEEEFEVHGGITCDDREKIGFECNHAGDAHPFEDPERCVTREEALADEGGWGYRVYCERGYVMDELKHLSRQLFQRLPTWTPFTHKFYPKLYRERMAQLYMMWYLPSQLKMLQTKDIWTKILGHLSDVERK